MGRDGTVRPGLVAADRPCRGHRSLTLYLPLSPTAVLGDGTDLFGEGWLEFPNSEFDESPTHPIPEEPNVLTLNVLTFNVRRQELPHHLTKTHPQVLGLAVPAHDDRVAVREELSFLAV